MALDPLSELRAATAEAVSTLGIETPQELSLVRPKRPEQGDYSINAAMLLAPVLDQPARRIAERLGDALAENLGPSLERTEVAGPGFLNVFLSDAWYRAGVARILASEPFVTGPTTKPSVVLEFVSANPTGPLTAASGRGAAYGD